MQGVLLELKTGGRGAWPSLWLPIASGKKKLQTTANDFECCTQHALHQHKLSVGSVRLELHRSVLRYCSELEGKEELMLKPSLCSEGGSCDSLV